MPVYRFQPKKDPSTPELRTTTPELVLTSLPAGQQLNLAGRTELSGAVLIGGNLTSRGGPGFLHEQVLGPGQWLNLHDEMITQTPITLWEITGTQPVTECIRGYAERLLAKDPLTAQHSIRVGLLGWQLGKALDLEPNRLGKLALAAYLHDIGKIRLPTGLLKSTKPLSVTQWQLMMKHPAAGCELLEDTPLEALGPILEQHHERLDGSGYPHGLKDDAVSLEAYIVAVADTFDAITHTRPYQPVRSVQHALSEINRFSDVLYPGNVVDALNRVSKSFTE